MNANFIIGLVEFIVALVALIIIHEFGHFIVAKLCKIPVEEFGIGFPPRITTLFTWAETKFTLNWIPLGGFVRPKGENDPEVPDGLAAANPWVRLAVLFAGPMMNLLVGVLLYAIVFARVGAPDTSTVRIVSTVPNSPAAAAGLQPGDIIKTINSEKVTSTDQLHNIIYANLDKPVTLTYQRSGQIYQTTLTPRSNPPAGQGAIGILMENPVVSVPWYKAVPLGGEAVYAHIRALLALPVQLATGAVSPSQGRLVGFKGMFDIYQEVRSGDTTATTGIPADMSVLLFFTNITISLGVLNLFPFPALDGGRILFTLPEIVLRRRIPARYENLINLVGFGLLLLLMIYVNLQDFISPAILPK